MAFTVTHSGTVPETAGVQTFELLEDGGTPGAGGLEPLLDDLGFRVIAPHEMPDPGGKLAGGLYFMSYEEIDGLMSIVLSGVDQFGRPINEIALRYATAELDLDVEKVSYVPAATG